MDRARPAAACPYRGNRKGLDLEGLQRIRLRVNNAPDVHFTGHVLHEYTTQSSDRPKDRWTELRLWETHGGAWIVEKVGCSTRQGEAEIRDVRVIEHAGVATGHEASIQEARDLIMDFFGWTIVAKAFAKQAGWDVVRRVE